MIVLKMFCLQIVTKTIFGANNEEWKFYEVYTVDWFMFSQHKNRSNIQRQTELNQFFMRVSLLAFIEFNNISTKKGLKKVEVKMAKLVGIFGKASSRAQKVCPKLQTMMNFRG